MMHYHNSYLSSTIKRGIVQCHPHIEKGATMKLPDTFEIMDKVKK